MPTCVIGNNPMARLLEYISMKVCTRQKLHKLLSEWRNLNLYVKGFQVKGVS